MFDRCLYFNLNALTRTVNRIWDDAFRHTGLSPAHGYLMRVVLAEPGITPKGIAEELELAPSTVTRFVDALVARKLLERRAGGTDARESAIHPTKSGLALHQSVEDTAQSLYRTMRATLGKQAFDDLVTGLRRAREDLNQEE